MNGFDLTDWIRPDLLGMNPYASARSEYDGGATLFLDANESPFENGVNRYPDPLQKKLKKKLSQLKGVSTERIFLGNGSDECIDLLIRLFCVPGVDAIATLAPTYGMYSVSAKINQVGFKEVFLENDFLMEPGKVLIGAKGSKILFLCSPNNPTGQSIPRNQIEEILRGFPGLVVLDEAYIDFAEQGSMLGALSDFPNLAISQTLSKAYGMAGIRLGMLFASPEIIALLNKIKPPYNINQLTQDFALRRLEEAAAILAQIQTIKMEREKLKRELTSMPFVEKVFPSEANFLLIRVKDAQDLYFYLTQKGIVVRNRSSLPLCAQTLRVSVGTEQENEILVQTLQAYSSPQSAIL